MKTPALHSQFIPLNSSARLDAASLDKAARGFESLFAQTLISSMRDASFGDPLSGGDSTYRDMQDRQLAEQLSSGQGLGLAQMLRRQLSGPDEVSAAVGADMLGSRERFYPLRDHARISTSQGSVQALSSAPAAVPSSSVPASDVQVPGVLRSAGSQTSDSVTPLPAVPTCANSPAAWPSDPQRRTPEQFVRDLWPHAQAAAARLGVCPKALIAQAALETGWGRRSLRRDDGSEAHNLFGIKVGKAWGGEALNRSTTEFVGGIERREVSAFRSYDSVETSFGDYVTLLSKSPRYAAAVAAGADTAKFAHALQDAGYATDPQYAAKITAIAEGPTLRRALDALSRDTTTSA